MQKQAQRDETRHYNIILVKVVLCAFSCIVENWGMTLQDRFTSETEWKSLVLLLHRKTQTLGDETVLKPLYQQVTRGEHTLVPVLACSQQNVIETHQLTFSSLHAHSNPRSTEWILMTLVSGEFVDMY